MIVPSYPFVLGLHQAREGCVVEKATRLTIGLPWLHCEKIRGIRRGTWYINVQDSLADLYMLLPRTLNLSHAIFQNYCVFECESRMVDLMLKSRSCIRLRDVIEELRLIHHI